MIKCLFGYHKWEYSYQEFIFNPCDFIVKFDISKVIFTYHDDGFVYTSLKCRFCTSCNIKESLNLNKWMSRDLNDDERRIVNIDELLR